MIFQLPKALKQTLLYGTSIALMKGISLLMLPFIAHHLSTEEFGRLEIITALAVIGSVLVGMGLEQTLFRFAGTTQDSEKSYRLAGEIFTLALIIGGTAWIIGWHSAEFIAQNVPGNLTAYQLQLVISMLALEGCISVPLGWLRMRNHAISFFLATTGRAMCQALLVIILLNLDRGVDGVLEAGFIAAIVQALILSILHIRNTGFGLSRNTGTRALIYSIPLVGSGLVAFALNGLDRWILAEHASLNDVAQFGVAAKFSLAMILLLQPFAMWWSPKRFEVLNGPDGHQKAVHFISIGITLALIVAVMVGLSAPLLIDWLMPESYAMSSQYVVALVLVMLFKELSDLVNLGCFTGNTTGIQLIINILGATSGIVAMIWLTPTYGVWGVILALMLAQAIRLILFFIVSQHLLKLPYPTSSLMLLTTISVSWLLLGSYITSVTQQLLSIITAGISLLTIALFLKLIPVPERMISGTVNR